MASKRNSRLQEYLSSQYTDFDLTHPTKRLTSLYSDFSKLALLNQYGYDANISYWRSVILDCNIQGLLGTSNHRLVFNSHELADVFVRPGIGKPLALDCVVKEMTKDGDIMTLREFNERYTPPTVCRSWLSWIMQKSQYWLLPASYNHDNNNYVVLPTVKEIAKGILQSYVDEPASNSSSALMTFREFRARYGTDGERTLTDDDIWLLLQYMSSELGVAVADDVQGYGKSHVAIKFPYKAQIGTPSAVIDQQDRAIISIRTTCDALHLQVEELQQKAEEYIASAKEHYAEGRKSQAMYAFKKKKHLLEILDRRLRSLETMETLLMKIEASQNDLQIVRAFNIGADALRNMVSEQDLSVEAVDEALFNVQQAFQDHKEVEEAIMGGMDQASRVNIAEDEEELEKELAELEQQEKQQQEERQQKEQQELEQQQQQQQQRRDVLEISTSPPPRQLTHSAPPPSPSESELARIHHLFGKLKKAQPPPSKLPSAQTTTIPAVPTTRDRRQQQEQQERKPELEPAI